jgi:hypothetical protein
MLLSILLGSLLTGVLQGISGGCNSTVYFSTLKENVDCHGRGLDSRGDSAKEAFSQGALPVLEPGRGYLECCWRSELGALSSADQHLGAFCC